MNPKLQLGEITMLFGIKVRVVEQKCTNICNQCEIHHLCNRDYQSLRSAFRDKGVNNCGELIGADRCFEMVKTQ